MPERRGLGFLDRLLRVRERVLEDLVVLLSVVLPKCWFVFGCIALTCNPRLLSAEDAALEAGGNQHARDTQQHRDSRCVR